MADTVDVVVVGAGLAGLTAARALVKAGASVALVEANDRVGGRTLSREVRGQWVDLGGQWLGPGQHRMAALVQELGIAMFPSFETGRKVLEANGRVSTYAGTIPSLDPLKLLLLQATISTIDRMRKKVPTNHPWSAPEAERLDGETVETWQRRFVKSSTVRDVMNVALQVVFGAEPSELSMLHFLAYANSGEGLMHLVEIKGGAQQDRFVRGAQSVSLALAEKLGDRVVLSAPVRRVAQDATGVTVTHDKGSFRGKYVVVATPPAMAGRIDWDPLLPAQRDGLLQRYAMGATIKCMAFYDKPFWRQKGMSGEAVGTTGPVAVTFDNSPHDASQGVLLGFLVGRQARIWGARSAEERKQAVLAAYARFFGPEAAHPVDWVEHDWSNEPFIRGCPTSNMGPGVMTQFGPALRDAVGRVHWAGTETASEYCGYMEGAVQSGERAAGEIVAKL